MDENGLIQKVLELEKQLQSLQRTRIGKQNIIPGSILPQHMSANIAVIVFDVAANRPTSGSNNCLAFWATDTHVLSIWDNKQWRTQTFT